MPGGTRAFLTFALGGEEYGVPVAQVKEIVGMMPFTAVPCTTGGLRGAVHFRGHIIPLVDLRLRLFRDEGPPSERSCIIILTGTFAEGSAVGVVVDAVSEVVTMACEEVATPPPGDMPLARSLLLGVGNVRGRSVPLLDMEKVLGAEGRKIGREAKGV